jgi:hypothetical protein
MTILDRLMQQQHDAWGVQPPAPRLLRGQAPGPAERWEAGPAAPCLLRGPGSAWLARWRLAAATSTIVLGGLAG